MEPARHGGRSRRPPPRCNGRLVTQGDREGEGGHRDGAGGGRGGRGAGGRGASGGQGIDGSRGFVQGDDEGAGVEAGG